MKTVEIKCDACGADLLYTGNCVGYRLVVQAENKSTHGGFVTSAMAYPAVDRPHHFCGLECLDKWRDRERMKTRLWAEVTENWKHERGTKHESFGTSMWSYPEMPKDIRDQHKAEIEIAALQAFP